MMFALAITPSIPLERSGATVHTRFQINGETQVVVIEPLNGVTEIREDLAETLPMPYRIELGDYRFEVTNSSLPTRKSFGDRLDRRGIVAMLGESFFREVMVGADYVTNSFAFISLDEKSSADQWVRDGAEGSELIRLKLRSLGNNRYVFPRFEVDGMEVRVAPFLLGYGNVIRPSFEPRHLSRGSRATVLSNGIRARFSLWRDVRIGEIHLPRFWGGYPEKESSEESAAVGTFPLAALGPRRIVWDPQRAELIFLRPSRDEIIEALLRDQIMAFPVDIVENRILAGRPPVLDKAREAELTGAPIMSIGGLSTDQVLKTLRGSQEQKDELIQTWLEKRNSNEFSFIVRVKGQNIQVNIPGG